MSHGKFLSPLSMKIADATIASALKYQKVFLLEVGNKRPPSDQTWAERALLLTHEDPSAAEMAAAFAFWSMRTAAKDGAAHWLVGERDGAKPVAAKVVSHWWDSIGGYRRGLRDRIVEFIKDPARAIAQLEVDIDLGGALDGILSVPRMSWDSAEVKTDIFHFCPNMDSTFMLALIKLFGSKDVARALRVCELPACKRIFISLPPPGGGPRPRYCVPEHREMAARLTGAERTAKWRKNQARKKK
jgi:hypothetical protein